MNARKSGTWLASHRATIGGSNSAAAVGLNKYKSRVELYYEMTEGRTRVDLSNNPHVLRGILMEPIARQRLRDELDIEVIDHDQNEFLYNTAYPFAHALPDGWIVHDGETIPIELKVPTPRAWERLDEHVPDYIQCQVIHNTAIIGAPAMMLCCLNPVTMQVFTHLYEPSEFTISAIMGAESKFMDQHIVPKVPPEATTHDDLKLIWPEHSAGKRMFATDDMEEKWRAIINYKNVVEDVQNRIASLSLELKKFMADAELLSSLDGSTLATWKSHKSHALDATVFKSELPHIHSRYLREKTVRPFLVKKAKAK